MTTVTRSAVASTWHAAVGEAFTHPKIVMLSGVLANLADPTGLVMLEPGNLYRLLTQANLLPPAARNLMRRLSDGGWLAVVEPETMFHDSHWGVWQLTTPAPAPAGD